MLAKLKVALVLVIIGSLSGASIYWVNDFTEPLIAENRLQQEIGLYAEIYPDIDTFTTEKLDTTLTAKITIFDENDVCLGYVYKGYLVNNYGKITVLVGIDEAGLIQNVVIASTTNTSTYVYTIKSKYLESFVGHDINDELAIDSRTGATYTYNSVVQIVESAVNYQLESGAE